MNKFQSAWIICLLVLFVFFAGIGIWIKSRPLGILIDDRNKISLSRLQLVLWSWILISAFVAVAISVGSMNIDMPEEVWALMGISVGSATGSVLVKGTKTKQEPTAAVLNSVQTAAQQRALTLGQLPGQQPQWVPPVSRAGIIATNRETKEASLRDLFVGDEITDFDYVDMSKAQMFVFTLATIYGYALILWHFTPDATHLRFPDLSTSIVTLLGISHAGYLSVKAAPKTPTT